MVRVNRIAETSQSAALLSEVRGWDGLVSAMAGDHKSATALIEESLRLALENDLPEQAALAYRRRANIAEYCSNYSGEVEAHKAAIQYCRKEGVGDQASCLSCLAYASFRTGDWQDALESGAAVRDDPDAHPALKAMAACVEGLIAAFRGQRRPAEAQLSSSLEQLRLNGLLGLEFFAMMGQAWLNLLAGNTVAATKVFDDVRALWRETDDLHDVIPALLFAGGHYAKENHADRLADCIDILMTIQRQNPLDEARAALIALKGEQSVLAGQVDEFSAAQEQASRLFRQIGLPLEQAWTGISAATAGAQSEITREAVEVARRLGLRPFLAALEEKDTAGRAEAVPCDLTPRQREVLGGLSKGLTSKEIADQLSLSTRTVEMHVSRLLERMNCRTRSEAVRLGTERGWV
jgi:DNA-binding CsgD family transcriptional regulator